MNPGHGPSLCFFFFFLFSPHHDPGLSLSAVPVDAPLGPWRRFSSLQPPLYQAEARPLSPKWPFHSLNPQGDPFSWAATLSRGVSLSLSFSSAPSPSLFLLSPLPSFDGRDFSAKTWLCEPSILYLSGVMKIPMCVLMKCVLVSGASVFSQTLHLNLWSSLQSQFLVSVFDSVCFFW